ncbi:MAG TPA: DinB family protein [Candidatus Limnocylindrales bacterium]|nr:DinB family protein [Candidatus Limnocylindrales bacterium]
MSEKILREHLHKVLNWGDAHADWKSALAEIPGKARGAKPKGAPYSIWELLEHARLAQRDILEFCRNPKYVAPDWPSGYWPKTPAPPSAAAWEKSVGEFFRDLKEMQDLAADPNTDLYAPISWGDGQTILREALLLADHNAYHLGQIVLMRRLVGAWKKS